MKRAPNCTQNFKASSSSLFNVSMTEVVTQCCNPCGNKEYGAKGKKEGMSYTYPNIML